MFYNKTNRITDPLQESSSFDSSIYNGRYPAAYGGGLILMESIENDILFFEGVIKNDLQESYMRKNDFDQEKIDAFVEASFKETTKTVKGFVERIFGKILSWLKAVGDAFMKFIVSSKHVGVQGKKTPLKDGLKVGMAPLKGNKDSIIPAGLFDRFNTDIVSVMKAVASDAASSVGEDDAKKKQIVSDLLAKELKVESEKGKSKKEISAAYLKSIYDEYAKDYIVTPALYANACNELLTGKDTVQSMKKVRNSINEEYKKLLAAIKAKGANTDDNATEEDKMSAEDIKKAKLTVQIVRDILVAALNIKVGVFKNQLSLAKKIVIKNIGIEALKKEAGSIEDLDDYCLATGMFHEELLEPETSELTSEDIEADDEDETSVEEASSKESEDKSEDKETSKSSKEKEDESEEKETSSKSSKEKSSKKEDEDEELTEAYADYIVEMSFDFAERRTA